MTSNKDNNENNHEQQESLENLRKLSYLDMFYRMVDLGFSKVDIGYLIGSHAFMRHIEELPPLDAYFEIENLWLSDNMQELFITDDNSSSHIVYEDEQGNPWQQPSSQAEIQNLNSMLVKSRREEYKQRTENRQLKKEMIAIETELEELREENKRLQDNNYDLQIDLYEKEIELSKKNKENTKKLKDSED